MEIPKRFIVVDDDKTSNLICKMTLRKFLPLAEIIIFNNPQIALQYIYETYKNDKNSTPTTLFLDVNMPLFSGFDFLETFNNFPSDIQQQFKIYMLTASIDANDQDLAISKFSVEGFLSKPLSKNLIQNIYSTISDN